MNHDDIIRMAKEAGFREPNPHDGYMGLAYDYRDGTDTGASLESFAASIVAYKHEEFAAKIKALTLDYKSDDYYQGWLDMRDAAEAAIRAEKQV